jgi:competence protein ComEC
MAKQKRTLIILVLIAAIAIAGYLLLRPKQLPELLVHYIDVGQADAILIQAPSGKNILIDAGNNNDGDMVVAYLKEHHVDHLDYVIGTHPHEDHIGGLDVVIRQLSVGKVYLPHVTHTTKTFQDVLLAIEAKGLKISTAASGVTLDVGPNVQAAFLSPLREKYDELNNYSAVLRLDYGNTAFLFMGDAEVLVEEDILAAGLDVKADVLKVGHHGSTTSTSATFLAAVDPDIAVIMVGAGNSYGHPHREIIDRLQAARIVMLRTDQLGHIVLSSDGRRISSDKLHSPVTGQGSDGTTRTSGTALPPQTAALIGAAETSPAPRTSEQNKPTAEAAASPRIEIVHIDLVGEVVTLRNNGDAPVDLSGWKLVSEKGNQTYVIPTDTLLAAGAELKIISGPNAQAGDGQLVWNQSNIWANSGDPGALYDPQGELVARYE